MMSSDETYTTRVRSHSYSMGSTRQGYLHSFRSPLFLPTVPEDDRPVSQMGISHWQDFSIAPGQRSPTLSTAQYSTTSTLFPSITHKHALSRKDVISNVKTLDKLAQASKQFNDALHTLAESSAYFAEALDEVSRTKELQILEWEEQEEHEDAEGLIEELRSLAAWQFYVASQTRVLGKLVDEQCSSPLQKQAEAYKATITELQQQYTKEAVERTATLKRREKTHLKDSRKNHQDFDLYRKGLEELTQQLDELDQLKYNHYETVAEFTRKVWKSVLKRGIVVARGQVDVWERISERGVQNDCLGRMIAGCGDPFAMKRPADIVESIERVERVERRVTPESELQGSTLEGSPEIRAALPESVIQKTPTMSVSPTTPTEPIDGPDDVRSIHEEGCDQGLDSPEIPRDIPETMTPPLTPPTPRATLGTSEQDNKRLLLIFGRYGIPR